MNCVPVIWGVKPNRPIRGAPTGRQRLQLRRDEAAKLFIRTASGIRCFVLEDRGDHWFCNPALEQGSNARKS